MEFSVVLLTLIISVVSGQFENYIVENNVSLQQQILSGYRSDRMNLFNIRSGGFQINDIAQCIIVNYTFHCGNETCQYLDSSIPNDYWTYLWTVFDAESNVGVILVNLAILDLRVFGFDICDLYKPVVQLNITLQPVLINGMWLVPYNLMELEQALLYFTRLLPVLSSDPLQSLEVLPMGFSRDLNVPVTAFRLQTPDPRIIAVIIIALLFSKVMVVGLCYEVYSWVKSSFYKTVNDFYYSATRHLVPLYHKSK